MRILIRDLLTFGLSERRACFLTGLNRSTFRFQPEESNDEPIRDLIRQLAARYKRFGYRRIYSMIRKYGKQVNHKRVYRIYREEGLLVRRRSRKKLSFPRTPMLQSQGANERWSIDFMADRLRSGRTFKLLTVADDFTKECLAIVVDLSISGERVSRELDRIALERGYPKSIGCDNGPEFRSMRMFEWSEDNHVVLEFIQPGKPNQNAYIESFNGKLRDECLNEHLWSHLDEAREIIEQWRQFYNEVRPHSALEYQTPREFMALKTEPNADFANLQLV